MVCIMHARRASRLGGQIGGRTVAVLAVLAIAGCKRAKFGVDEPGTHRTRGTSAAEQCIEDVQLFDLHTCFRFRGGAYWCLGDRGHAQVVDRPPSATTPSFEFKLVVGSYRRLALGWVGCGLDEAGAAHCWGDNVTGFIRPRGPGEAENVRTPLPMPQLGTGIESIVTSTRQTCILRRGEVQCAVSRASGSRLDKVEGLPSGVRQIAIGSAVGCAATRETVYCWGAARWARTDEHGSRHSTDVPGYMSDPLRAVAIDGPRVDIASLDVGGQTGGVVTSDGGVYFFGSNEHGQWGNRTFRYCGLDSSCPDTDLRRFHELPSLGVTVRQLAIGGMTTCVLDAHGSVWCWGYDGSHEVTPPDGKDGGPAPRPIPPGYLVITNRVRRSDLGTDNVRLLVGGGHYCVEKRSGSYWCWGDNYFSQLAPFDLLNGRAPFELDFPAARCPRS